MRGPVRARVLIVTTEYYRIAAWRAALLRKHFAVAIAQSHEDARRLVADGLPDVLLLDLGDPALDGLLLCRQLRADGITLPVLMAHTLGTLEDLLDGFEAGADDYLRGWFEPAELLGHIGALYWRHAGRPAYRS
jgi:DNA-binding response OmpR family regulator